MLIVTLDVSPLIATLDEMEQQLKSFPNHMGEELTAWQTEDMRRRYPNTEVTSEYVQTSIWPTSRTAERDPQKIKKAIRIHKSISKPTFVKVKGQTQRPILRPSLYEKLVKRMDELMPKYLGWKAF